MKKQIPADTQTCVHGRSFFETIAKIPKEWNRKNKEAICKIFSDVLISTPGESMTMKNEQLNSEQCRFDRSEQAVGETREKDNFTTEIKD